jgi:hypothetical protein
MGHVPCSEIQKAANHLLHKLTEQEHIRYSNTYYDGSKEQELRLRQEMQLDLDDTIPALLVDLAVYQLENIGWVEKQELECRLCDGEPDYTIALTLDGRRASSMGEPFNADHQVL